MTLNELINTLKIRKQGLAYELWKTGNLCQLMENYPESPEKACPELYPPKPTIKMEQWMLDKYYK